MSPTPELSTMRAALDVWPEMEATGVVPLKPLTSRVERGEVVPMPTLPCKIVFVIELFPRVTVLLPLPMADAPMTISLVSPADPALVLKPRKMELLEVWLAVEPSAR